MSILTPIGTESILGRTIAETLFPHAVEPMPAWERETRLFMMANGYAAWPTCHVLEAIRDGIPVDAIDPEILALEDREPIRAILARHRPRPAASHEPYEPSEADLREYSEWLHSLEPSPEDRAEWAATVGTFDI